MTTMTRAEQRQQHDRCCSYTVTVTRWEEYANDGEAAAAAAERLLLLLVHDSDEVDTAAAARWQLLLVYGKGNEAGAGASVPTAAAQIRRRQWGAATAS